MTRAAATVLLALGVLALILFVLGLRRPKDRRTTRKKPNERRGQP